MPKYITKVTIENPAEANPITLRTWRMSVTQAKRFVATLWENLDFDFYTIGIWENDRLLDVSTDINKWESES